VGVVLDSFGQPIREGLASASRFGLRRIELPAVGGEVDPEQLSRSARRHLRHYMGGLGLELSALGSDLGGARFNDPSTLERRLEKTRAVMEMAAEMHVPIVTAHLGTLDEASLEKGPTREVVAHLAELADRTGTFLAFETGQADPQLMGRLLAEAGCTSLGACYDPASLLIDGFDPVAGVEPLADRILIARARDAMAGQRHRPGREVRFGEGEVDFAACLAALDQAGYRGTSYIRRTDPDRPMEEIGEAKELLEGLMR
jgi:sugar phosphate isomerase/epimerase